MTDPIVDEVRRHRMEHTRRFGGDMNLIFEDLRRIQRESAARSCGAAKALVAPAKVRQETVEPPIERLTGQ